MKNIKKNKMKEGYYWEFKPLYDSLPEALPVVEFAELTLEKLMTYADMQNEFGLVPERDFEVASAIALSKVDSLKPGEYRVIFFMSGTDSCRLGVWRRGDGQLSLRVDIVSPDHEWGAGRGVLASNGNLGNQKTDTLSLSNLDTFTIECGNAINLLKEHGFKVTRTETRQIEY